MSSWRPRSYSPETASCELPASIEGVASFAVSSVRGQHGKRRGNERADLVEGAELVSNTPGARPTGCPHPGTGACWPSCTSCQWPEPEVVTPVHAAARGPHPGQVAARDDGIDLVPHLEHAGHERQHGDVAVRTGWHETRTAPGPTLPPSSRYQSERRGGHPLDPDGTRDRGSSGDPPRLGLGPLPGVARGDHGARARRATPTSVTAAAARRQTS